MVGLMNYVKTGLVTVLLVLFILMPIAYGGELEKAAAQQTQACEKGDTKIVLFWGKGCPHCETEIEFLSGVMQNNTNITILSFETWYNKTNAKLFEGVARAYGTEPQGVPTTIIGDQIWVGFSDEKAQEIGAKTISCLKAGCENPLDRLNLNKSSTNGSASQGVNQTSVATKPNQEEKELVRIPFVGEVNAASMSVITLTLVLALLDSFNPCAFFVLFFLLSMLVYAQSRKKMLLIGGTFVFFSGLVYFLFMAAWLNLFLVLGKIKFITWIAGGTALIISIINIKDFFFFKEGISLSISEGAKPRLFERMRNLLKASSLPSMMLGTIVLAIAANSYELLCTAGFPMVFTRVLTLQNLSAAQHYAYLALYNVIYIIPLAIIVLGFTLTLGARKLTEEQGQMLKLISGLMMLYLGVALIVRPDLLTSMFMATGILVFAFGSAAVIIILHKHIKRRRQNSKGNGEEGARDKEENNENN